MGSVAAQEQTGEAQLFERNSALVYRYCLRMLGSREDAEDATQTTFFQALRALRRGVSPEFERAWLLTIAKNECKSRFRASSRRRARELAHDPMSLAELATAPEGDGRLVGVEQALARLPEMQRRALLLREWQGRSYAEIARELGASRPAVEALLFRARRGLARELGEETPTMRRHAFDLASLLGALKSLLSGGAAVKLAAAGVAAVATAGTVAITTAKEPTPVVPAPQRAAEETQIAKRPSPTPRKTDPVRPSRSHRAAEARTTVTRRAPTPSAPRRPAPSTKAAPRAEEPVSPPASAPGAGEEPRAPSVPSVPVSAPPQPPPVLPTGQLPQVPQVPQVPQLPQVPVPQVPELPQIPAVPEVPDLPGIPLP